MNLYKLDFINYEFMKLTAKQKILITLYIFCFVIFLVLFILFSEQIKALFFVTGFILLNIFISAYKKNFQFPIEIEILTLGIFFCTYFYGINAGLIVGIVGGLLSSVLYGYVSLFLIPMIIGNMLVAVLTPLFSPLHYSLAGIILTIIKNGFVFMIYHFVFGYNIGKNLSFSISNILLNIVLFLNIAPFLMLVMN